MFIGQFTNALDSEYVIHRAEELAKEYGNVRLADMYDLVGDASNLVDDMIGWTIDGIKKAEIVCGISGFYSISMPAFDWCRESKQTEDKNFKHIKVKRKKEPEPINITISSGEWDTRRNDIEQAFSELFKNSDKIKDRPIFINIM